MEIAKYIALAIVLIMLFLVLDAIWFWRFRTRSPTKEEISYLDQKHKDQRKQIKAKIIAWWKKIKKKFKKRE